MQSKVFRSEEANHCLFCSTLILLILGDGVVGRVGCRTLFGHQSAQYLWVSLEATNELVFAEHSVFILKLSYKSNQSIKANKLGVNINV